MSKRETGAERRARLDEIQKAQKAEQRKRTLLTAGVGLGVGVLIIGGSVAWILSQESSKPKNQALSSFGVSQAEANCNDVQNSPTAGGNEHVPERVDYDTAPPSSGKHRPTWADPNRHFYTTTDVPDVEFLVHNLEHGHNIVWYMPTLPQEDVDTLKGLSEKISDGTDTYKFIVAPWDTSRGEFPEGMNVGMSHWGAEEGSIQHCEAVSGEAIGAFVDEHPITDAPEPNAP